MTNAAPTNTADTAAPARADLTKSASTVPASTVPASTVGTQPRFPRGRRTTAAVIVAIMLLLLAGYAAWQAILVQLGRQPYPLDAAVISANLNQTPWNHLAVTITGVVLALIGLWLLVLALTPARPTLLELREPHPDVVTGIRPADVRRALDGAAERIDGISSARTVLGRRTVTTTVTSPLGNPAGLTERSPPRSPRNSPNSTRSTRSPRVSG